VTFGVSDSVVTVDSIFGFNSDILRWVTHVIVFGSPPRTSLQLVLPPDLHHSSRADTVPVTIVDNCCATQAVIRNRCYNRGAG
jgi:hypothetical protein